MIFGVILMFVSTGCMPVLTCEGTPDLMFTGISVHTIIYDQPALFCTVKNNGTATASDYMIQAFGGLFLLNEKVINNDDGLAANDSVEEILFVTGPYFGIYRLSLYVSTTTAEDLTSNNHFSHSYFIISSTVLHVWVFKELPW
jgi:hypothetical protein